MSLQGSPTPGVPSSTPTVRPGKQSRPAGPWPRAGHRVWWDGEARTLGRGRGGGQASRNPELPAPGSTCSRGKWQCQQSAHCSSTCTLYGEGHVVTFDGQRFVFDGNCEYILATVRPGGRDHGGRGAALGGQEGS